jgi:hypothetical protein
MLKKILVILRGQKKPVVVAPRDGDGDGKINDGKPTEAPAPAKKPAAKKAPAKKAPAPKKK